MGNDINFVKTIVMRFTNSEKMTTGGTKWKLKQEFLRHKKCYSNLYQYESGNEERIVM